MTATVCSHLCGLKSHSISYTSPLYQYVYHRQHMKQKTPQNISGDATAFYSQNQPQEICSLLSEM